MGNAVMERINGFCFFDATEVKGERDLLASWDLELCKVDD
jgi:hypothetical protein